MGKKPEMCSTLSNSGRQQAKVMVKIFSNEQQWCTGTCFGWFSNCTTVFELFYSDVSAECAAWNEADNAFILYLTAGALRRSVCAGLTYASPLIFEIQRFHHTNTLEAKCPHLSLCLQWHSGLFKKWFYWFSEWRRRGLGQWAASVCVDRKR